MLSSASAHLSDSGRTGHRDRWCGGQCPQRERVQLRPQISANPFPSLAQFSDREAKDLALVLRFGSLPVELTARARAGSCQFDTRRGRARCRRRGRDLRTSSLVSLYLIAYYRHARTGCDRRASPISGAHALDNDRLVGRVAGPRADPCRVSPVSSFRSVCPLTPTSCTSNISRKT